MSCPYRLDLAELLSRVPHPEMHSTKVTGLVNLSDYLRPGIESVQKCQSKMWKSVTMASDHTTTEVSRRIEAPANRIFNILANPQRHADLDGSEMLRGAVSDEMITGVGDVFFMNMYLDEVGDYLMMNYVVEFEVNRRIGWKPAPGNAAASNHGTYPIGVPPGQQWSFHLNPAGADATIVTEIYDCSSAPEELRVATKNGDSWIESMTVTLARLDSLCTQ
jgi:hypothetical protein